jgi:hypothetical protein
MEHVKRAIKIIKEADRHCQRIVSKEAAWKRLKRIEWSLCSDVAISCGAIVYKVIDPHDETEDYGYMLYGKDTTAGSNVWRLIIYEKSKAEFNAYCRQTPFDYCVVK